MRYSPARALPEANYQSLPPASSRSPMSTATHHLITKTLTEINFNEKCLGQTSNTICLEKCKPKRSSCIFTMLWAGLGMCTPGQDDHYSEAVLPLSEDLLLSMSNRRRKVSSKKFSFTVPSCESMPASPQSVQCQTMTNSDSNE